MMLFFVYTMNFTIILIFTFSILFCMFCDTPIIIIIRTMSTYITQTYIPQPQLQNNTRSNKCKAGYIYYFRSLNIYAVLHK